MVSAFSAATNVVLGQVKTAEKSNEITAVPELIKLLELRGCLVTLDAMGCQRNIAQTIIDKGADYLLAVKSNQGRMESRMYIVSDTFDEFVNFSFDWPGMKTLGIAMTSRIAADNTAVEDSICFRYYISSAELTAKEFAHASREHWSIENKLHWKLDASMREDDCRIRRGDSAEELAGIRHIAVNMLNNTKRFKAGLKRKQKKAAMSEYTLSF